MMRMERMTRAGEDQERDRQPGAPRAAVLLVGNELLTGKIRDENGYFLAGVLRRRGVSLVEMCTVPDDLDRIGEALIRLLKRAPTVFTSGGVGPTHDDVTLEAIARATGCPLEVDRELEELLRGHYGDDAPAEALAMANIPRGTRLRALPGWPVLRLDPDSARLGIEPNARIYMLPGIPALLRAKIRALEALPGELPRSEGWTLRTLRTTMDESSLAGPLRELLSVHPTVEIGSYPRWVEDEEGRRQMEVKLTFESESSDSAEAARDAMAAILGAEALLAREDR
jgi:molybdenum cofactor synthesis domain-containing protein